MIARRGGFTLAELLVGIALVAIASGAIFSFYSIGIDTERRARERSETTAALRLVYKLLDERIGRRATDVHSLYMKAGAFAAFGNLTAEILRAPLDGENPGLERALGFGDLAGDGVAGGTVGALLSRVPGGRLEISGPFVLIATLEASLSQPVEFSLDFADGRPDRFAAGGFAPEAGSVEARPGWAGATVEVNTGTLHDLSPPQGASGPATASFRAAGPAVAGHAFRAYASTGRAARLRATAATSGAPVGLSLFHVRGAALLSDDGLLFHEEGDGGAAHALYLRRPPAGEGELDADGNPLLELRYAFSTAGSGGMREVHDDPLVSNIKLFKFKYYDENVDEIVPGAGWTWLPGGRVARLAFEIELDRGGAGRADLPGWRP